MPGRVARFAFGVLGASFLIHLIMWINTGLVVTPAERTPMDLPEVPAIRNFSDGRAFEITLDQHGRVHLNQPRIPSDLEKALTEYRKRARARGHQPCARIRAHPQVRFGRLRDTVLRVRAAGIDRIRLGVRVSS